MRKRLMPWNSSSGVSRRCDLPRNTKYCSWASTNDDRWKCSYWTQLSVDHMKKVDAEMGPRGLAQSEQEVDKFPRLELSALLGIVVCRQEPMGFRQAAGHRHQLLLQQLEAGRIGQLIPSSSKSKKSWTRRCQKRPLPNVHRRKLFCKIHIETILPGIFGQSLGGVQMQIHLPDRSWTQERGRYTGTLCRRNQWCRGLRRRMDHGRSASPVRSSRSLRTASPLHSGTACRLEARGENFASVRLARENLRT